MKLCGFALLTLGAFLACIGCASDTLHFEQDHVRDRLLELHEDQIMDNLIRVYQFKPILQLEYKDMTGTVKDTGSATLGGGQTDTSGAITNMFNYSATGSRENQITITGTPVNDSGSVTETGSFEIEAVHAFKDDEPSLKTTTTRKNFNVSSGIYQKYVEFVWCMQESEELRDAKKIVIATDKKLQKKNEAFQESLRTIGAVEDVMSAEREISAAVRENKPPSQADISQYQFKLATLSSIIQGREDIDSDVKMLVSDIATKVSDPKWFLGPEADKQANTEYLQGLLSRERARSTVRSAESVSAAAEHDRSLAKLAQLIEIVRRKPLAKEFVYDCCCERAEKQCEKRCCDEKGRRIEGCSGCQESKTDRRNCKKARCRKKCFLPQATGMVLTCDEKPGRGVAHECRKVGDKWYYVPKEFAPQFLELATSVMVRATIEGESGPDSVAADLRLFRLNQ